MKAPQMFIENQYVRVFGIIKSLQGQKIVQAFKILPVKDLNEITHHILDVMNSSIHYYAKANGEQFGETSVNAGGSFGHTAAAKSGSNHGDASFGGLSGFQFNVALELIILAYLLSYLIILFFFSSLNTSKLLIAHLVLRLTRFVRISPTFQRIRSGLRFDFNFIMFDILII